MGQHFDISIMEIIKNRHSVRTYNNEPLSEESKDKLREYAATAKAPFAAEVRLVLVDNAAIADKTGGKIGTYGVIKGAKHFITGVVKKGNKDLEQLGYSMEKLMLYGEALGLGSCWLGGTFKRSQFAELAGLKEDEIIPAVSPVGFPAERRGILDSMMRKIAGSDNRKAWDELFFDESFNQPLTQSKAGKLQEALEMVRLAPSASNKQPWRILKQGETYHFYLKHAKGYSNALGFDIQRLDMGIAMCHFEMTAEELGVKGSWTDTLGDKSIESEELGYIVSWVAE